jgi:ribosomal protein S18 acetylase RimI-like enzyme
VDETVLMDRNLRGLATLLALIGRSAGRLIELEGATGSIVPTAPDYPWVNALVCERGADFRRVLEHVAEAPELSRLAVWACEPDQLEIALEAGFTDLVARVPAMAIELENVMAGDGGSEPIGLTEAGAVNDEAYGNQQHELESILTRLPVDRVRARGRRDSAQRVVAAAVLLHVQDDCSVQYVATRPGAQRLGHGAALLRHALGQARLSGCTTSSLQSSEAGVSLYRRLGYHTVGHLQLRRRPT